ncbi:MAG TPA: DUF4139 domain-containing protein [Gemmataceae bacterium]|nr:DUF4139 domain-containing protein [Gemmataceae bacterium]
MWKRSVLSGGVGVLCLGAVGMMLMARTQEPTAAEVPPAPKVSASRIVQVTVYPNSALVTREVEVPEGSGAMELVVSPLPEQTVGSSLYSEGTDGIRVLTTRFRTRPVREDTREEVRKIEDQIKKLRLAQQRIQADINALQQNLQLLGKLENFTTASTTHAAEKGKLESESAIALAKYLMDGRAEKSRELVALQQQLQDNQEQLQFAQRQLNDVTAGTSRTERDAVIVVDKTNGAAGKVRLNYLVSAASWRPQYKLRAGKDAKDPVQLEYLAAVVQQTGEDWSGVRLALSTAQPMLNAAPPTLQLLALNVVPRGSPPAATAPPVPLPPGPIPGTTMGGFGGAGGRPGKEMGEGSRANTFAAPQPGQPRSELDRAAQILRQQAQDEINQRKELAGIDVYNFAGAIEQAADLVLEAQPKPINRGLVRSRDNEGPSVTYHLGGVLSVPSRADEQVIEVARLELAPDYYYKAVPVLTRHVYRLANLTNTSKYVLLPGEATMYQGSDFVGRMDLPLVAIGEAFTVGFGVDPQLQVQRQLTDKARTMQGGNQVLRYEYRLLVSSYKPEKVKLQVWDRLPHAESEMVGVTLVKATPELSTDPLYQREERPNNLLRWDVEVDPSMAGEKALAIRYEFKMELDRNMTIGNFWTR